MVLRHSFGCVWLAVGFAGCNADGLAGMNDTKVDTKWKGVQRPAELEPTAPQDDGATPESPGGPTPDDVVADEPPATAPMTVVMIGPQVLVANRGGEDITSRAAVLSVAPIARGKAAFAANMIILPSLPGASE